jgi:uncharacterized protein (TIGR04222 family)
MSILDLRGPEFLQIFLVLFPSLTAACLVFRWLMAGPFGDHPSHEPDLDPLEVAYLAGGAKSATDAAITSLVHRGALTVRGSSPPRLELAGTFPDDSSRLETAVHAAVNLTGEAAIRDVRKAAAPSAAYLAKRLEQYEYLLDPMRRAVCYAVPVVVMSGLLMFGASKIVIGINRDRPVVFLLLICFAVIGALFGFAVKSPHRTRRGTRFLARLKDEHAALYATASVAPSRMSYADIALAYALYGPAVLSMGPLAELNAAMKPRKDGGSGCGGSSGSSCGSSCGGGGGSGCGGGGCGGCGGGGD